MKPLYLSVLATLLFSCSSERVEPDDGPDPLDTLSGFCQQWATAACTKDVQDACGGDADDCTAAQKNFCEEQVGETYANSPAAQTCLDAVGKAYADADLTRTELEAVLAVGAPCDQLWSGPKGAGQTCTETRQCKALDGAACIIKLGDTSGECQTPEIVPAGERCDQPQQVCDETRYYCDGRNCVRRGAEDDPCVYDGECDASLHCALDGAPLAGGAQGDSAAGSGGSGGSAGSGGSSGAGAGTGTCKPRSNDVCDLHADCESGICSRDVTDTQGVCVGILRLTPKNELCEYLK